MIVLAQKKLHLGWKEAVLLIAITKTTQKCQNSTEYGLLTILIDVTATWIMVNAHMQWNMDEMNWLLKVKTNLDCHSREEHVKGHRGETIPEDENSNQSLFPRHKRLHVCWIIKPNRYFVSQIFVKSYLCLQSINLQHLACISNL